MVGRVGRSLLGLGGALVVVVLVIAVRGGSVGLGGSEASGGLVAAVLVTLGAGLLLIGLGGRDDRPWTRLGLGMLGGGLLDLSIGQLSIVLDPTQPDQLGNGLWVTLGIVGIFALVGGSLIAVGGIASRR